MEKYHSGTKGIQISDTFIYNVNIYYIGPGYYETLDDRDFKSPICVGLHKTVDMQYNKGKVFKHFELIGAPIDWLIEHNYLQKND